MSASVFSIHNGNIADEVLRLQKACVEKFLPAGWNFTQVFQPFGGSPHALGMEKCVEMCSTDIIVFLDTDCIPLRPESFPFLQQHAESGTLVGNIQRSNHIQNNAHVYVAPSCMAFSLNKWRSLNSPSFYDTARGDIGEELTYFWEQAGQSVLMLRPVLSNDTIWDLEPGARKYGHGTVFGEYMFYHEFQIRTGGLLEQSFITKCKQVLG